MPKSLIVFVNVLIFALLVIMIPGLDYRTGSFGDAFSVIAAGLIFSLASLLVENLIKFFKFPVNFWSLVIAGFLVNFAVLALFAAGLFPAILIIKPVVVGSNFAPLPIPSFNLETSLATVGAAALVGVALQMLFRRLAKS